MSEKQRINRLYFVYNADSGTLAAIVDSAKKLLSINGCPLCSLTHSLLGERTEWKTCRDTIGVAVDYVHRDELTPAMKAVIANEQLPCVLAESRHNLALLLTADTIRRCNGSLADLRGRLNIHAAMRNLAFPSDDVVSTIPTVNETATLRVTPQPTVRPAPRTTIQFTTTQEPTERTGGGTSTHDIRG
jgi:hypothetical protein